MRAAVADSLRAVLAAAWRDSAFPGAFAVAGTHEGVLAAAAVGRIDWAAGAPAPDEHTLWDLASLTKVVVMTTAMMQLVEEGRVSLDAPVQRYLPDWRGAGKERVTVRQVLTHTSGLPAFIVLPPDVLGRDTVLARVFAVPLDTVPGARMVYSDLGATLAGLVVERVTGESLDAYARRRIFRPLGMHETMFRPDPTLLPRIAPTEFDPTLGRLVRGEVHDERARAMGGVSAHAGLFGSAHDLVRFARMYLNGGVVDGVRVVRGETIALFTRVQDAALSHRALGWETPNRSNSAGTRLSARAFGHTGFTGTSLWIDPAADLFVVLLSNRVNPSRENRRIVTVRPRLADAVAAARASAATAPRPSAPTPP
ncbi:MAG TPA: serine hydrolase domain-containing protein [Gemmatimonadaceae bacterium]|nr:serine hydrolase domain-containing protein [Gemmatimonadaceae bacterium]